MVTLFLMPTSVSVVLISTSGIAALIINNTTVDFV